MWIRTQEDELVNLGNIEYIRLELDEENGTYEVRAYAFGWEPDDAEDEYYPLASGPDQGVAEGAFDRVADALARGDGFLDLRSG